MTNTIIIAVSIMIALSMFLFGIYNAVEAYRIHIGIKSKPYIRPTERLWELISSDPHMQSVLQQDDWGGFNDIVWDINRWFKKQINVVLEELESKDEESVISACQTLFALGGYLTYSKNSKLLNIIKSVEEKWKSKAHVIENLNIAYEVLASSFANMSKSSQ